GVSLVGKRAGQPSAAARGRAPNTACTPQGLWCEIPFSYAQRRCATVPHPPAGNVRARDGVKKSSGGGRFCPLRPLGRKSFVVWPGTCGRGARTPLRLLVRESFLAPHRNTAGRQNAFSHHTAGWLVRESFRA